MYAVKVFVLYLLIAQKAILVSEVQAAPNGEKDCSLPSSFPSGWWTFLSKLPQPSTKLRAPSGSVLELHCKKTYKLSDCPVVVCKNGTWDPPIGQCLKTCPSLCSTPILTVTCTYKGQELVNCTEPVEGTLAQFKCASFYEDKRVSQYKALCHFGEWSEKPPECTAVCGQVKKRPTLGVGVGVAKNEVYPWQISLYRAVDKVLVCAGSLLSERVALTAAHCITDESGISLPKNHYLVVAGKYHRRYDHPDDRLHKQVSEIFDIFVPQKYKGEEENHDGNLAVIVTKMSIKFSGKARPVCMEWSDKFVTKVFFSGKKEAHISSWSRIKENSEPGDEPRSLSVVSVPVEDCRKLLPPKYRSYMTHDKICTAYKDKNSSVCSSDGGGGLVLEKNGKFIIAGSVGFSPLATKEECSTQRYIFVTMVYDYANTLILKKLEEFKLSEARDVLCKECRTPSVPTVVPQQTGPPTDGCILPPHPDSGRWSLEDSCELSPGDSVASGTVLNVDCLSKYRYNGSSTIFCINGQWTPEIGKCLKTCQPFYSPNMEVNCTYNNQKLKNCFDVPDGTIATSKCHQFYEFASVRTKPSVCMNGEWSFEPECVPACGKKVPYVGYGYERYPWHVAIYRRSDDGSKAAFCEGSFVSTQLIITAARCVTDSNGKLLPNEDVIVAAGFYYPESYSSDTNANAEFYKPEEILIPAEYRGANNNYLADIAIIALEQAPKLSSVVQPVCLDWGTEQPLPIDQRGFTSSGNAKEVFIEMDMWIPYRRNLTIISLKQCKETIDEDYKKYLTNDKFCGSWINYSLNQCNETIDEEDEEYLTNDTLCGVLSRGSTCELRSGGGLIFKDRNRYYLVGVYNFIPASLETGTCDDSQNGIFTEVKPYIDNFILNAHVKYRRFLPLSK